MNSSPSNDTPIQGVIETIDNAIQYRGELSQLIDSLNESKSQVQLSASRSKEKLRAHFDQLKQYVCEALEERFSELQRQVLDVEKSTLKPLLDCEAEINKRVETACAVLQQGKSLLESEDNEAGSKADEMKEFKKKSTDLNSLPVVPCLWETPCINVDLPRDEENVQKQLVDAIREYGKVIDQPPVQISEVEERPGGVSVKWGEVPQKDGHTLDLNIFRLEYCVGKVRGYGPDLDEIEFVRAYEGPESVATVRGLRPQAWYSLRVCGRVEGAEAWSPWSVPLPCQTTINRYEWRPKTAGYLYDNDYTSVLRDPDSSQSAASTLVQYTRSASCACGGCVRVSVERAGPEEAETGVGLSVSDCSADSVLCKGMLYVNTLGVVYVDGQEKTTRLPALQKDSVVTFDTELIQPNRVRVTVEVSEKVVTFDWLIDAENSSSSAAASGSEGMLSGVSEKSRGLFVFSRITSSGWKLRVD